LDDEQPENICTERSKIIMGKIFILLLSFIVYKIIINRFLFG